jgi:coenzyme A diphosphatase NUDT7
MSDSLVPWLDDAVYRMHRFRSSASPIKGLTAEIMVCYDEATLHCTPTNRHMQISVASAAYNKPTTYERFAHGQLRTFPEIWNAVRAVEMREESSLSHASALA